MTKNITVDLHSHSGYSGGVGQMNLDVLLKAMKLKGIDFFGTGDILHPAWGATLENSLSLSADGIYTLQKNKVGLVLQTEVVFTYPFGKNMRKSFHQVILFPDFKVVKKARKLLQKWGVKNSIGRPFITCDTIEQLRERIWAISRLDQSVEQFPAHIMTPEGILGSKRPVSSLKEVYGEAMELIHAVETGLSADPPLLSLIPELDHLTLISNSDCHSARLDRLGREYTELIVDKPDYPGIIEAIRKNSVVRTIEFHPEEGRYFLTGHRGDKMGHNGVPCMFEPGEQPDKCPICKKPLTIGVKQRALELGEQQTKSKEFGRRKKRKAKFIHAVPLVEIIALAMNIKNCSAKGVLKQYDKIIQALGSESVIWRNDFENFKGELNGKVKPEVIDAIGLVKSGKCKITAGYDGEYGKIRI